METRDLQATALARHDILSAVVLYLVEQQHRDANADIIHIANDIEVLDNLVQIRRQRAYTLDGNVGQIELRWQTDVRSNTDFTDKVFVCLQQIRHHIRQHGETPNILRAVADLETTYWGGGRDVPPQAGQHPYASQFQPVDLPASSEEDDDSPRQEPNSRLVVLQALPLLRMEALQFFVEQQMAKIGRLAATIRGQLRVRYLLRRSVSRVNMDIFWLEERSARARLALHNAAHRERILIQIVIQALDDILHNGPRHAPGSLELSMAIDSLMDLVPTSDGASLPTTSSTTTLRRDFRRELQEGMLITGLEDLDVISEGDEGQTIHSQQEGSESDPEDLASSQES